MKCALVFLLATHAGHTFLKAGEPNEDPISQKTVSSPSDSIRVSKSNFFLVEATSGAITTLRCDPQGHGSYGPNLLSAEGMRTDRGQLLFDMQGAEVHINADPNAPVQLEWSLPFHSDGFYDCDSHRLYRAADSLDSEPCRELFRKLNGAVATALPIALLGLEPTAGGLRMTPQVPSSLEGYEVSGLGYGGADWRMRARTLRTSETRDLVILTVTQTDGQRQNWSLVADQDALALDPTNGAVEMTLSAGNTVRLQRSVGP